MRMKFSTLSFKHWVNIINIEFSNNTYEHINDEFYINSLLITLFNMSLMLCWNKEKYKMKKIYNYEDCILYNSSGLITIRCPECKNHDVNIDSKGDCKNIITLPDGNNIQCQCYSKEHK